ncbi:MAG TPA: hypothetical protein VF281_02315 [Candidatus Saccharimonadales bacterium]
MNIVGEAIAIVAIMIVLRVTSGVLNGRELRKWRRAYSFMATHLSGHGEFMAMMAGGRLITISMEMQLNVAIDCDDQDRSALKERLNLFEEYLTSLEQDIRRAILSEQAGVNILRPDDKKIVAQHHQEWQKLFDRLVSINRRLQALLVTRVAVSHDK